MKILSMVLYLKIVTDVNIVNVSIIHFQEYTLLYMYSKNFKIHFFFFFFFKRKSYDATILRHQGSIPFEKPVGTVSIQ